MGKLLVSKLFGPCRDNLIGIIKSDLKPVPKFNQLKELQESVMKLILASHDSDQKAEGYMLVANIYEFMTAILLHSNNKSLAIKTYDSCMQSINTSIKMGGGSVFQHYLGVNTTTYASYLPETVLENVVKNYAENLDKVVHQKPNISGYSSYGIK